MAQRFKTYPKLLNQLTCQSTVLILLQSLQLLSFLSELTAQFLSLSLSSFLTLFLCLLWFLYFLRFLYSLLFMIIQGIIMALLFKLSLFHWALPTIPFLPKLLHRIEIGTLLKIQSRSPLSNINWENKQNRPASLKHRYKNPKQNNSNPNLTVCLKKYVLIKLV